MRQHPEAKGLHSGDTSPGAAWMSALVIEGTAVEMGIANVHAGGHYPKSKC